MRCQHERLLYRQARCTNHASATTSAIRFAELLSLQTACPRTKYYYYIAVMSCDSAPASWYYGTQLCECSSRGNVQVSVREVRVTFLGESQRWVQKCSSMPSRSLCLNVPRRFHISFTSTQHWISAATFVFYVRMVLRWSHSSDYQFCNLFRTMKWI